MPPLNYAGSTGHSGFTGFTGHTGSTGNTGNDESTGHTGFTSFTVVLALLIKEITLIIVNSKMMIQVFGLLAAADSSSCADFQKGPGPIWIFISDSL